MEDNKKNAKDTNKPDSNNKTAKEPQAAPEIVAITKSEYEALKARAAEQDSAQDKFLRTSAEFENARKRFEKEKIDCLRYANESLILELLPILDNLEIAEKHIKEAKDFDAVRGGVDMIQQQMQVFLKDIGLERIRSIGEKFDPHIHDAIEVDESADKDGVVLAELKPGYKFNGRLLRPAMVKIAKKK